MDLLSFVVSRGFQRVRNVVESAMLLDWPLTLGFWLAAVADPAVSIAALWSLAVPQMIGGTVFVIVGAAFGVVEPSRYRTIKW